MTSSYSMNLKTGAKAKVLKAQIDAVFTSAKLAEARAARIKISHALQRISGIENNIFCQADVGQPAG